MRNRIAVEVSLIRLRSLSIAAILAGLAGLITAVPSVSSPPQTAQLQGPQTACEIRTSLQGGRGTVLPATVIQEYRVGETKVVGARFLKPEFLVGALGLVSGEVFDELRLRKGLEDLKRLYGCLGHVNFVANPVMDFDEQRKVVNFTVNIDEDRQFFISSISITGNATLPDEVIRREILFKEGYVFNASMLEITLLRLNKLGLFEEIKIEDVLIKPSANEPKLDIVLRVKEKTR